MQNINPNVENIRSQATRVIRGTIPSDVRKALYQAVKDGLLGRLPKNGLMPEIFFHPDHRNGAIERQKREAVYGLQQVAKVLVPARELTEEQQLNMAKAFSKV